MDSSLASEESGTVVQEGLNEELPGHREDCDATIVGADSATAFPFPERQNDARSPVSLESILHEILWKTVLGAREGSLPHIFQQFCRDTTDSWGSVVIHPFQRFQDFCRGERAVNTCTWGLRGVGCNLKNVRVGLANTVQVKSEEK